MTFPGIFLAAISFAFFFIWGAFSLLSLQEKHFRAARIAGSLAIASLGAGILPLVLPITLQWVFAGLIAVAGILSFVLFFLPMAKTIPPSPEPKSRVDERTIMFARARLQPGTTEYHTYYQLHPEHQAVDDAFRQNPGLLQPTASFYAPLLAASSLGGFFLTEALRYAVDGPVAQNKTQQSPEKLTALIKNLARYHGALDVGICELQPYHVYTNIGRGTGEYGAPIHLDHRFAIAFTVEMAHEMINAGPRMPAVMESARQYAETGKIAVILAAAIRALGYAARAHIDGNYRVIVPLVAKDAGLGEIGRMGILMTPRLGPRVRLAVVTTDLPLISDAPTRDPTVIEFCSHCNKCAVVCPSQAIPYGDRQSHEDGTLRWKLDAERCYTYWTRVGTDCGRCMAVCPYAHADNVMHSLIRYGVQHSGAFRRAASWMDDVFYGKKPAPHNSPRWITTVIDLKENDANHPHHHGAHNNSLE